MNIFLYINSITNVALALELFIFPCPALFLVECGGDLPVCHMASFNFGLFDFDFGRAPPLQALQYAAVLLFTRKVGGGPNCGPHCALLVTISVR